ncbi:ATP-dependent Clp protease adaptor ClpS [Phocaeicola paurosaccharolyticus]|uniref:ATP-dependent Clp protease adaptor ClpS n=1 Tax=Phocaeicola paurosaccharolyticus TaxID=732242 RepID=UPI00046B0268|nr:ATP-dependent Clp protease adaptor ClpS [Phocaeicola paurosaccharolyticus]
MDTNSAVKEKDNTNLKEPSRYSVILHNDDFTTMEFVVLILTTIFGKTEGEANEIMIQVHKDGKGIAGVYSFDIAHSKANKASKKARDNGFPLKLTVEKE